MMNIRFHTEITFSCQSLQHQDNKQLFVRTIKAPVDKNQKVHIVQVLHFGGDEDSRIFTLDP
jgi:hypothetical protein